MIAADYQFIPLADLVSVIGGATPSKGRGDFWNGTIPWVSPKDMKTATLAGSTDQITEAAVAASRLRIVPPGSILVVVRGMILAHSFPVAINAVPVTINQDMKAFVPGGGIRPRYLALSLNALKAEVLQRVTAAGHGTRKLDTDQLLSLKIPLASIDEQQRIINVMDDAERIRRLRTEANAWTAKAIPALFHDMFGDPICGGRWPKVRVSEAGEVQLGRQRSPMFQTGKYTRSYVRVANVLEDRIDASDLLSMDFDERDFAAYRLYYGDILLNEGQSTDLVGRPAMWRDEVPDCCFQNTLIRFRSNQGVVEPEFALAVFLAYLRRGEFAKISSKTSNVAHLGAARFAQMPFPLPPLELQRKFSERVREIRELLSQQETSTRHVDQLYDTLLHHAFGGELLQRPSARRLTNVNARTSAVELQG